MDSTDPQLSTVLEENGTDGYLLVASSDESNQYYLSGYRMPGVFVTLYTDDGIRLLVPDLEYTRACAESDAETVRRFSDFEYGSLVVEHGRAKARPLITAAFLSAYGIRSVSVPDSFPTGTAAILRDRGIEIEPVYDEPVERLRAVKTETEIEHVVETQRANEQAMAAAEDLLKRATVEDGVLSVDGDVLTSERVRRTIEATLLSEGCGVCDCIVAAGAEGAVGHAVGSGPIEADEPIIVDIAPQGKASGYCSDMTRTFVKGNPDPTIRDWYALVREAHDEALETIEPGVTGEAVNEAVCEVFEREGYPTPRTDEATENGFLGSTGHGVGLDVHELPRLSWGGGELQSGHVVAVEPGLYERGTGGVRLEDVVVVTETGYENLTDYPRELRVL
ncbi:M24 family metallopeptidase [Halopiger djelfimassiliensis]|uniref:M24 family metallopeptidase n=1 Tax=Halopiger djelfimassiliensis TaxID=1293047 RepID=UPI000677D6D7|nr:Xaa-Pro peptidase family protein [Halopiger djelfimassiliensis]